MTSGQLRRIFLSAPPWRALVEGWLAAGLALGLMLALLSLAPSVAITMGLLVLSGLCALTAALRLRPFSMLWQRAAGYEILFSGCLALGFAIFLLFVLAVFGRTELLARSHVGPEIAFFFLLLAGPGYLALRFTLWIWLFWDRLRRRRFLWALTHAHLSIVAWIAGFVMIAGLVYMVVMDVSTPVTNQPLNPVYFHFSRLALWIFGWGAVTVIAAIGGMLLILPPSALLSFWVARRLTRRLEKLATATHALRSGDLAVRVPVEGEDELAQLQADFNAMATDQERATLALQGERDKVAALLRSQQDLLIGVSHELRTPVATLNGYIDSLQAHQAEIPAEELQRDLQVMAHEVDRLQVLIGDLLTLARAEVSQLSLDLQPVAVEPLAQQAVASVADLAWQAGRVQVVAELAEDLPPARVDPRRLEQALLNLLHNGVRHTPPGGIVVVTACQEADLIRLQVVDTGAGIPAEELPHVWERYFRAPAAESDHSENFSGSLGLGLALVKELVEAMGGRVGVESQPGEGSTFSLWLPVDSAS